MEYTPEQLNYFKISYTAFNLVPEALRRVFKQEWNFLYMTTLLGEWKDIPQNGHDFYNNETGKSRKKYARYLTMIQKGNTAEWDCSCLFFAILFSDSIGTTLSATIRKEVDILRQIRNDIAHKNEAKLSDAEFQSYVARVIAAFTSLKLSTVEVEDVKNQSSFPTAEVNGLKIQTDRLKADLKVKDEEVKNLNSELQLTQNTLQTKQEEVETLTQEIHSKVESFCSLTFRPSHQIIRRSNDVTRIKNKLEELYNESKGAISTIYLSGIPGCGKSQIARQVGQELYDKRLREDEGLTFVSTLNAETLDSLADSYFTLAKQLGVTEYALTNLATSTKVDSSEIIQHLTRFISPKVKQFSTWLIILDNVVDLSLVLSYLPPTTSEEWGHGQMLVTTQDTQSIPLNSPHTYHESLSNGMHPDDAVNLLREVSQISNQQQAEEVAGVLEYQPLALAAAAVYVQTIVSYGTSNYGWTKYLETLNSNEREAREDFFAKQNRAYPKTTTTAIKMAITRALQSDEVLREVLCLFSLCASDSLPIEAAVDFVKFRTKQQTEELTRARILKSTMVSYLYDKDGTPTYVRVHKVVHEVLKSTVTSVLNRTHQAECFSVAVRIFHSLMEENRNLLLASEQACGKLRIIVSHCKVLFQLNRTKMVNEEQSLVNILLPIITPSNLVSFLSLITEVCYRQSNLSDAYLFSTLSSDFITYLSDTQDDKLQKAKHFHEYGIVHLQLGHFCQAKEYHEKSLAIKKQIHGEHHGDIAKSYNSLGNVYRTLGQYNQAKEYYEKSLAIRKEIYGEHHGDVATNYNNLGTVYSDLGQYIQAKEYHEKSLAISKEICGDHEHHGDVATSYNNLGLVYSNLGQYNQAKEYHEKSLAISKEIYGEHHGDVATSYNNLGLVYSNLGQYNQAKEYHEKSLAIRKEIYDEHHGDVAINYNNLGTVYNHLGQYNQAKEYHEKSLAIRKEIYGEHHGDVAASYSNLGLVYSNFGQYNQAKEYHEKSLAIMKEIYGEHHGDVAKNYNNLGLVYGNLGLYNQAKEYHEKSLAIKKEIYGEHHGDVAISYNNLGLVYSNLGQYNQAKEYHEKSLAIMKEMYGAHHGYVATSYNNLGNVYSYLGQYNQAKEYYEKSLAIAKEI
ncbi:unnamed protein product [Porites lobata]|uniref:UDP-N-acetylglucosamine--peptide N-acetylglucosaminyltransferase SPINDLY n=1 Tax=Porites lobata TaxID=104759 RepID=A0ABN8RTG1_9CNID|nr:unnamed protein product [Porites lobata]